MARDAQNQAKQTYKTTSDLTGSSEGKTGDLYNTLVPQFTQEMTNPAGFNPKDKADMLTGAQESAGGAVGAADDRFSSMAAANRNFGGFAPAVDEAARAAGRNLATSKLGLDSDNAKLKEAQRQSGIAGLTGLEGQQNSDVLSSLGLQDQSTDALTQAGKSGWFQNMTDFMNASANSGKAAAGLGFKI